jgi:hypothetical protein
VRGVCPSWVLLGIRLVVLGRLRARVAVVAVARGHLLAGRTLDAGRALAVKGRAGDLGTVDKVCDGAGGAGS